MYQTSILEFITDAILQQTPLTLSDERTVRPDDANAKHARVVATALQEFSRLLGMHQQFSPLKKNANPMQPPPRQKSSPKMWIWRRISFRIEIYGNFPIMRMHLSDGRCMSFYKLASPRTSIASIGK